MKTKKEEMFWGITRLSMGWIFLWAFLDKLFGLGFSTCRGEEGVIEVLCQNAWLSGGSPTFGFLTFGTQGPLADFYQSMAGNVVVDWLFMAGLLLVGLALISGIMVRIAGIGGALMMLLMYTAALLPANNPFMDSHIIYALVLLGFTFSDAGKYWGLGKWWSSIGFVFKNPILK